MEITDKGKRILASRMPVRGTGSGLGYRAELKRIASAGLDVLSRGDDAYPEKLGEIYDPPLLLFAGGRARIKGKRCLAVTGNRSASRDALHLARVLAREIAGRGVVIVTGLATGVETAAHIGGLEAGESVCVLGCGFGCDYPPGSGPLKERTMSAGRVFTEYGFTERARPSHFPRRNRIMIGISDALLVVEADEGSAALHMADNALEEGREVMVLPAGVRDGRSAGGNRLIQEGARLVQSVEDILEGLPETSV